MSGSHSSTRQIQAITSGPRRTKERAIKRLKTADYEYETTPQDYGVEGRCELDSRADTCCAGVNCRPLFFTGHHCEVHGFHDDFTPLPNVPIATVATMWNDPITGQGFILILHETLYFGKNMDHSLINPNQLRHHGLTVHDNPYDPSFDRKMGIEIDKNNKIPSCSQGSIFHHAVPNGRQTGIEPPHSRYM